MKDNGWIKMHRKLVEHPCFKDPDWVSVWVYLLLSATHKPHRAMFGGKIIDLEPGQLVTGRRVISEATGVQESKCKRILMLMETDQQIDRVRGSKSSLISIRNWRSFQETDQQADQQMTNKRPADDQQMTSTCPADDQQVTTIQECKNGKNGKNEKNVRRNTLSASADAVGGEAFYLTKKKRKLTGKRLETFERFWKAFDYPKGKADAADAWLDVPQFTEALVERICQAAQAEARKRPGIIATGKTPKMAQGWISSRRWEDYIPQATESPAERQLGVLGEPLDWKERANRKMDEGPPADPAMEARVRNAATWRDLPGSLQNEIILDFQFGR